MFNGFLITYLNFHFLAVPFGRVPLGFFQGSGENPGFPVSIANPGFRNLRILGKQELGPIASLLDPWSQH